MTPEVSAFVAGFPIALLHALIALGLVVLGAAAHAVLSSGREISQIRDGNPASAVAFAGVIFGLALSQARSLSAAPSLMEIALWGGAVLAVQLLLFWLVELLLAGLSQRIRDEADMSAAVLLSGAKLATALILAAAISG